MRSIVAVFVLVFFVVGTQEARPQGVYDSAKFNAQKSQLSLLRITPNGKDVPNESRQIVFKFNQPVVAIGDMQRDSSAIPISISPPVKCEWRWLDTSSLACQLNRETQLELATEYSITVEPGIETLAGLGMTDNVTHSFITKRPKLSRVSLNNWSVAARPVANLYFNQPVTKSSVEQYIRFSNRGLVLVSPHIDREFNALTDGYYRQANEGEEFVELASIPLGETEESRASARTRAVDERGGAHDEARLVWRVSPSADLPADSLIDLQVSAGLTSIYGDQVGLMNSNAHTFRTLAEFEFLGVGCYAPSNFSKLNIEPFYSTKDILRDEKSGEKLKTGVLECDPLNQVMLKFSSPVSYASANQSLTVTPNLAGNIPDYNPWTTRQDGYALSAFFERRFNYASNDPYIMVLPEMLKAYQQYGLSSDGALRDELGRKLGSKIDMSFLTSHRAPLFVYDHRHSVLEKEMQTELPITVTNIDEILVNNYSRVTVDRREENLDASIAVADVEDIAYAVPLGVRGLLEQKSGVVVGTLNSTPELTNYSGEYYRFVSQVTPFQVHLKFGHFNSYAWVTDLATGEPVAGAAVRFDRETYLTLTPFGSNQGAVTTDENGLAILPGISELDPELTLVQAYRDNHQRLMLKVAKGDDMAVLPLDRAYAAWAQVWHRLKTKDAYAHAWGTTAQGVYKAGDTIQYKFYVRNQSNEHWITPPLDRYQLEVIDPKGQTVKSIQSLSLSEFGTFDGEVATLESAAVGWYQFKLSRKQGDSKDAETRVWYPMQVLVSDFTPSPFRVSADLNSDGFEPGDIVSLTTSAKMHAGGPYADAQTRVTANLSPRRFSSSHPQAKGFNFAYPDRSTTNTIHQSMGVVSKAGELVTEFKLEDFKHHYGRIKVESAVRDDRGKYVANSASADYIGRDRFIGLRNTDWVHDAGRKASVEYLVVDAKGQPVEGVETTITIEYLVTRAARVKGAGNAYLTQYSNDWVQVDECAAFSKKQAQSCEFVPDEPGSYRFTAAIKDSQERENSSRISTWVVGDGAVLWSGYDNHQIEMVPDSESYKVGDVAKFLVKNPYPGSEALITVERYGVLRHWRKKLNGSTPIIEIPIKGNDYPGVYVSVVVSSPRVAQPLGDGNVDLGKPTFKMGYIKVPVRDDNKEINVEVKTDKAVYKPRDKVSVSLKAKPKTGKKVPMEMAVVVIDEAVFDLNRSGRSYYDPHNGFNRLEELGVANYNLLMKLIGRQKFENKGANPGGGGGGDEGDMSLRNLMKFVAYWDPSIEVNKSGRANFDFTLPDNLTGWRVFAMAVTKEDRMGMGDVNFKVNRPTELRPVMPNQLTEGDSVQAGFSVMNRTDKPRSLEVELRAVGSALSAPLNKSLQVELAAFERKRIWMPVSTSGPGELAFLATAGDDLDRDAVEHHIPVNKRRSLITAASYGTTTGESVSESFAFPDGIHHDVGGLSVEVSPSVIGNVAGAFRYMRDYPYRCWEQRLTKGLAASQYTALKSYLPADLRWNTSSTVPDQTLASAATFQAPNGGMTYWVNDNAYVSSYLSAYTALGFVWLREQGHTIPEQVENKLHEYLLGYLRRQEPSADVLNNSSRGMRSSIRAVAMAALAKRGKLSKQDLERYELHVADMDLFGKAHFLQAAMSLDVEQEKLLELGENILSYSVQSGGKFQFNEQVLFGAESMLHTPARSNCAVLSSFLDLSGTSNAAMGLVGDVPFKQVRAITQTRGGRDYWANTQENLFCMNALVNFSRVYESESPDMQLLATSTTRKYGEQKFGSASFSDVQDESVIMQNPELPVESGLNGDVKIAKQGAGRVYYAVRMSYAQTEDSAQPINAGLEVRREYSVQRDGQWQLVDNPLQLAKGDVVRVDIFVSSATARHFVVIDDPVPGGLEPVNRDLATASEVDSAYKPGEKSWWHRESQWTPYGRYNASFYHQELRHDSARFYSDYLPAGNYHLSYSAQVIAGGEFSVLPVKAEEMYDPDVYGLGLPATLQVEKAQ